MTTTFACSFARSVICIFLTSAASTTTGTFAGSVTLTQITTNCRTSDGKYWNEQNYFLVIGC